MPCPRCSWSEYDASDGTCGRCGYTPGAVAVDPDVPATLDAAAREDLAEWFQMDSVVSSDAHSVLYGALDLALRKRVLLRVIALEPLVRAGLAETLRDAVSAAAALNHPHIHPVLGMGTSARVVWVSMAAVRGVPLASLLARRGALALTECQRLMEQLGSALHHAHRRGVIHGAVHPSNVLVDDDGWALLSGFGVGRVLVALALQSPEPAARAGVEPLAPEDQAGLRPTPALDQFGLGVTAAACVGGMPAIGADGHGTSPAVGQLSERLSERLGQRPGLTPQALGALQRAVRPMADERFRTVLEFVSALGDGDVAAPRPAAAPPAAPYDGEQEVVFVEERPRRPFFGLVLRAAAVVAIAGAGLYRLMGAQSGPTSLPAAVVLAPRPAGPTSTTNAAPPAPAVQPPDESLRRRWDSLTVGVAGGEVDSAAPDSAQAEAAVDSAPPPAPQPRRPAASPPPRRNSVARTPAPRRETVPVPPGRLFVSSRPWGQLYVDGQFVGNTPAANIPLAPGVHHVRIVREGFRPYAQDVLLGAGEHLRLVDLVLQRNTP